MDASQEHSHNLMDIEADECWSLAASQPVGRLAWSSADGPVVIPVNFEVTGKHVHVRTAAYSALARECDDSDVAFEVDSYDADARTGWSVLMRGRAQLVYGGSADQDEHHEPDVWPSGARALRLVLDVDRVSGRRVS